MLNPLANVFTIEALRALRDKVKGGDAVNAAAIVAERERAMAAEVTSAEYDSANQRIDFKSGTTTLFTCDARPFVKDGMVDTVVVENGYLKITFNTDAGKQDISIPISDIFDADNYYTKSQTYSKSEVDSALAGKVDKEQGKGLSTNDFTDALKAKLDGIQNRAAAQGGQDNSLVTTGDKFFWNSWVNDNYEVPTLEQVVTIGGRDYPVVQIGNRIWMAETLDSIFDGMTFVGPNGDLPDWNQKVNSPYCYYYDRQSSSSGGMLYTFGAVKYLIDHPELLPAGWRVPSMADFADLKTAAGDNSGTHLKATSGWDDNGNGDNSTGFNAVPAGEHYPNGMFGNRYTLMIMWSSDYVTPISIGSYVNAAYLISSSNTLDFADFIMNTSAECLRLCKDT